MKKQKNISLKISIFTIILLITIIVFNNPCPAQMGWPVYTKNVLLGPNIEYIEAASMPGSIITSGCWGYPWFTVPGGGLSSTNAWDYKSYYMYYPPVGWFDSYIYPFWHIYNVADPYGDFPNFTVMVDNPGTWIDMPLEKLMFCNDPICYYLGGGIHFFSGALTTPFSLLQMYQPSLDTMFLRYLGLMGLFGYDVPARLAVLPVL